MEALRNITQSINTFVRFFESINYLFCQIRWLEQNIANSSPRLLLFIGCILSICGLVYYSTTMSDTDPSAAIINFLINYGPILVVVLIIGYLIIKRFSRESEALDGDNPSTGTGSFESVFFGSSANRRGEGFNRGHRDGRGQFQLVNAHPINDDNIESQDRHNMGVSNLYPLRG